MSGIFTSDERRLGEAVSELSFGNPFLPERIENERRALGEDFVPTAIVWSLDISRLRDHPNVVEIQRRSELLTERCRQRLASGQKPSRRDLNLYEGLVLYVLFYRYESAFYEEIVAAPPSRGSRHRMSFYRSFRQDVDRFLGVLGRRAEGVGDTAHLFALFFQVRRAFHHIFHYMLGGSMAAAQLRAAVWQSLFTHDPRRYRRGLYARMHEVSTLITGPSGTGKDLVANAIGLSGYIPFDPGTETFTEDFRHSHLALNLSALSPTLIESELFGHRKGAFTGAIADRDGYLEGRGPSHAVFLDEIGDLDPAIQVKLLRVLQTREFQRIGDTGTRHFGGKIIAATNRDLKAQLRSGRFRMDFYYRLCSDMIETPTLAEQVWENPAEMHTLVRVLAGRLVSEEDVDAVTRDVERWIETSLGPDYPWTGNVRELEQCVRNVLVHGRYMPLVTNDEPANPVERLAREFTGGSLTADELLDRYCTLVYARTGEYTRAARSLQLDRRTVKRRIDEALLEELRGCESG